MCFLNRWHFPERQVVLNRQKRGDHGPPRGTKRPKMSREVDSCEGICKRIQRDMLLCLRRLSVEYSESGEDRFSLYLFENPRLPDAAFPGDQDEPEPSVAYVFEGLYHLSDLFRSAHERRPEIAFLSCGTSGPA